MPPIIGQDIPVTIKNIEPPFIVADQNTPNKFFELQVKKFLEAKLAKAENISLERIQRGLSFCLVADITLDGKNLARLLVEEDLARPSLMPEKNNKTRQSRRPKISQTNIRQNRRTAPTQKQQPQNSAIFVASKNGKVFHKTNCSHAKRISPENIVRFKTRTSIP